MAAFDAVVDDFCTLCVMEMTITPIIVKPEAKKQNEACSKIEQKEYIHIQPDHSLYWLEAFNIKETGHTGVIVNALDPFS